ncbi:AAA family ATPase [Halarcobacter anaerophilus]|uniref:ATP-binding protein n=1 Tax=Halarcobacter anaerophilus TaxID=877500 RepID=A0A4Q0XYF5_9BACT|nr:ATP-binding protein [Halarcobacter anaerophilus]QDF29756.1 ATP-binding protein [Halarcobacter anaerophilus]RXJ62677.1 ATP-binding protein [Halarcobacter anaerophilus]
MISPFPYDKISDTEHFYGRDKEIKEIEKLVGFSNNMLIHSKRRMGKSSLINYFLEIHKKDYLCIYVDIFDITSKEDFAYSLLKALSNSQKSDLKSALKMFASLFKRVRVEPTIDPVTLKYSLKPVVVTLTFEQMMEDFFNSLNELSKKNQIILAIDEFQQVATIKDIKLDAYLRTYIQNRKNISYIFLGSKRHLLNSFFEYKAPLYELANHFELKALKIEDIYVYAKKYLQISKKNIEYIYEKAKGETKLIQNILHLLYVYKIEKISEEKTDEVIDEIINSKDGSFRLLYDTLNNNQKTALKIVGHYKSGFFNTEILKQYNIKKQTLQSSINTLFNKELIDKNEDKYFIPDRTLELWVERL